MDTKTTVDDGLKPGEVRDRRIAPRGVLPRRVQTWIMAGLALLIVTVIVLTGHQAPAPVLPSAAQGTPPTSVPPERIRTFQREMAERGAREALSTGPVAPPEQVERQPAARGGAAPADPLVDERRRREYQSVFADNVAFSTRSGDANRSAVGTGTPSLPFPMPSPQELAAFQQSMLQAQGGRGVAAPAVDQAPVDRASQPTPPVAAEHVRPPQGVRGGHRLLEGTFIETVLLNRLDGTFSGPVACLVTTPVYSEDRQTVLIPAGARLLGDAAPVQMWGDSRLSVSFHRLLLPNGATFTLDQFKGLNQVGETGLKDSVNRHYLQVFGASIAVGALSGLAQWDRGGSTGTSGDGYLQSSGSSLAASTGRILDRYLNVLPTITIREGHRIKVYLTNDLSLPAYTDARAEGHIQQGGAS